MSSFLSSWDGKKVATLSLMMQIACLYHGAAFVQSLLLYLGHFHTKWYRLFSWKKAAACTAFISISWWLYITQKLLSAWQCVFLEAGDAPHLSLIYLLMSWEPWLMPDFILWDRCDRGLQQETDARAEFQQSSGCGCLVASMTICLWVHLYDVSTRCSGMLHVSFCNDWQEKPKSVSIKRVCWFILDYLVLTQTPIFTDY